MAIKTSQALTLAIFAALLMAAAVESSVTCAVVANKLASCVNYAKNGGQMPPSCCTGVSELKAEATTPKDRQTACQCIKDFAKKIDGIKEELVAGIPDKCGVKIGYPIRLSTDCSKVK